MKTTAHSRGFLRCLGRTTSLAVMSVALAWMAPAPVHAIGACVCHHTAQAAPFFTRKMPLNPRLFVWAAGLMPGTMRLLSGSEEIPTAIEPVQGRAEAIWVRPRGSLRPSTEYVVIGAAVEAPHETLVVSSFTTVAQSDASSGLDTMAPAVSGAAFADGGLGDHCGAVGRSATLMFASLSDDFAGADVIVQVDAEDGSRPPAFLLSSGGPFRQSFGVGTNDEGDKCLGYKRFGSGEGSAFPSTVRLTIWDWSGNSTVLEGQTLPTTPARSADAGENDNAALDQDGRNHGGGPDTMSKQAGGCSMAQGRSGWPLLTLVIASLLASNRRQRRKREVATQSPKNRER